MTTQQAAFDLTAEQLRQHDAQKAQPKLRKSNTARRTPASTLRMYKTGGATIQATPQGAIAEAAVAFLWLCGWGLNGLSTVALGWLPFVNWFADRLGHGEAIWLSYWFQIPMGVIIHILISRIEQDLWRQAQPPAGATIEERAIRLLRSIRTYEAVLIGSIDSITAALGVLFFCSAFGLDASWTLVFVGGLFGTALAMGVEPMLKYHGKALKQMLRGRR